MDTIQFVFIVLISLSIIVELIWSLVKRKPVYNLKESFANAFIIIGGRLLKPITLAWAYLLFDWASTHRFFTLPVNGFTLVLTFFTVEFVYYWYHRWSHEIPVLWTIHHTHHSSLWFNFFTAGRLNWLGKFTSPFVYLPMVMVGFAPKLIVLILGVSLIYQLFLHTEMIQKIGFLEGKFFNTPSAHRVHHASNEKYIDKNYGGMLIIYDRWFGTYQPEMEKVDYGVTTGFMGHNPIKILFFPLYQYLKKVFRITVPKKTVKG